MSDDFDPSTITWVFEPWSLEKMVRALRRAHELTLDIETTGLSEFMDGTNPDWSVASRISLITMTIPNANHTSYDNYALPLSHPDSPWCWKWQKLVTYLCRELYDSGAGLLAHNAKFDLKWLYRMGGYDLTHLIEWDTLLSSHLLDENIPAKLKRRVPAVFDVEAWDDFRLDYPGASEQVPLIDLAVYGLKDTYWCQRLADFHRRIMFQTPQTRDERPKDDEEKENGRLGTLARNVSMPTVGVLTRMEQNGILLDQEWCREKLRESEAASQQESLELVDEFPPPPGGDGREVSFAPTSLWFQEWAERAVQYGELRVMEMTKTGKPKWNSSVLSRNASEGSTVAEKLLQLRKHEKEQTYLRSWLSLVTPEGRIHAGYNPGKVVSGRLSSSDPNLQQCLLGSTEVLTDTGWVRFSDLQQGSKVVQVDEGGRASFTIPEIIKKKFSGNGVRISGDWINLWTTPDHRMLSYTRGENPVWSTAQEWVGLNGKIVDRKFRRAGFVEGEETFSKNLQLAVAVQADGSFNCGKFDVKVTKGRKKDRIEELTRGLPVEKNTDLGYFRIPFYIVSEWIDSSRNFKTEAILQLGWKSLEKFVNEVMFWDGDYTRGCSYKQKVTRVSSVDTVQAAAALCGRSTTRYQHRVGEEEYPTVNLHRKSLRCASRLYSSVEWFSGDVYCVSVPTGAFIIRDNGTVLVTGNCSKELRPAFLPDPGKVIVDLDLSQIELRLMAFVTRSGSMLDAYKSGKDLHKMLSAEVLSKNIDSITKEERQIGKTGNFSLIYQISTEGFQQYARDSYGLVLSLEEAKQIQDTFFNLWDGVTDYHKKITREVTRTGQVTSPLGRVRRLPRWMAPDEKARKAINNPIQGCGSDFLLSAAASIAGLLPGHQEVQGADLLGTVHDSLVIQTPGDDWEQVARECVERMTVHEDGGGVGLAQVLRGMYVKWDVPITAEAEAGSRWGLSDIGTLTV